jgi:transposase
MLQPQETAPARTRKRRAFTLQEKLDIVRQATAPGVRATHVARRHGIAVNQLYYWRKLYRHLLPDQEGQVLTTQERQIADLRIQVQKLETLLGRKTFEMILLQERLAALTRSNDEA